MSKITYAALRQFYGTENYYRMGDKFVYTDGIKYLSDNGANWLLQEIFLHQTHPRIKDEPFQSWTLRRVESSAGLTCTDGNDKVLAVKEIEYTDFPLPEINIFVELGSIDGKTEVMVCMLPSER